MIWNIDDLQIEYESFGEGKNIILLHGWGQSYVTFQPIIDFLKQKSSVWVLDLPGFGKSQEPKRPYFVDDYVDILRKFITKNNINDPIILGHSFGGRIALKYEYKFQDSNALILVDSAGIKPKRGLSYYLKIYFYKLGKMLLHLFRMHKLMIKLRNKVGSKDYLNASDIMRKTLINVVNEDLTNILSYIDKETLLIWGEHDQLTPLKDAYIMEEKISDSGLVILKGCGHHCYLDDYPYFITILDKYLEDK